MKPKFIAITSAVCVFAYSLYEAPSENDVSNNVSGALSSAAKFSSNIRRGLKQSLRSAASGAAEERLELDAMPSFSDVAIWSELSRTNVIPPMHHYLWTPAVANFERPSDSVELMRLERRGNFYTMTFRGLVDDWSSTTVIRDKQPMLISVAIRYYSGGDDSDFRRLFRKAANISWMPQFISKYGEKGSFILSDYRYTFTTREYFDWVKANGPKLYAQARIENEAALANAKASGFLKNIEKKALAQLDADEAWASKALDLQMETVSQQLSLEDN